MNLVEMSRSFLYLPSVALLVGAQFAVLVLAEDAHRLGGQIHVVADVLHLVEGRLGERAVLLHFVADLLHQHGERGIGALGDLVGVHIIRDRRARIAQDREAGALRLDDLGGGVRGRDERRRLRFRQRAVQRIGGRRDADQDQHDEAHALLAVVGAVEERNAGAGEHQQPADPQRRRRVGGRRGVERRRADEEFHHQQQQGREDEAEQRRKQQGFADFRDLAPIDPRQCRPGRA